MTAAYWWEITEDHITTPGDVGPPTVGIWGPGDGDKSITSNRARWAAYDDDGELYYEGTIYGDYTGFEPLDDFARPDSGCTGIKIDGKWL